MSSSSTYPDQAQWLTPPQVAKMLGVKPLQVNRWVMSGQLEAVDFSAGTERSRWKMKPEAVDEFLASRNNRNHKRPSKKRNHPDHRPDDRY